MSENNVIVSVKNGKIFSNLIAVVENGFTTGTILNFLGFIKNYPVCRTAACKKLQQSQLGLPSLTNGLLFVAKFTFRKYQNFLE